MHSNLAQEQRKLPSSFNTEHSASNLQSSQDNLGKSIEKNFNLIFNFFSLYKK